MEYNAITDGSLRILDGGQEGYYCEINSTDNNRMIRINSFEEVLEKYPLFAKKAGSVQTINADKYNSGQLIYVLYNYLRPKDQVCFIHFKRNRGTRPSTAKIRCFEFKINDDFTMCLKQLHWDYSRRKMIIERQYHFDISKIEVDLDHYPIKFYWLPTTKRTVVQEEMGARLNITWAMEHLRNSMSEKLPELLRMLSGIVLPVCRLIYEYAQI